MYVITSIINQNANKVERKNGRCELELHSLKKFRKVNDDQTASSLTTKTKLTRRLFHLFFSISKFSLITVSF